MRLTEATSGAPIAAALLTPPRPRGVDCSATEQRVCDGEEYFSAKAIESRGRWKPGAADWRNGPLRLRHKGQLAD